MHVLVLFPHFACTTRTYQLASRHVHILRSLLHIYTHSHLYTHTHAHLHTLTPLHTHMHTSAHSHMPPLTLTHAHITHAHHTHMHTSTYHPPETPSVNVTPVSTAVNLSESVTLMCEARGSPRPSIIWTKVSDTLEVDTGYISKVIGQPL